MANPILRKESVSPPTTMVAIPTIQYGEMIRAVPAEQIERICLKIAENISNHIGTVAKAHITKILMHKKGKLSDTDRMLMTILNADAELAVMAGKSKLFTEQQNVLFAQKIIVPMKKIIADAFSTPSQFLKEGIAFNLHEPNNILEIAAQEMGVPISPKHIPPHYTIELKWNVAQSLAQHILVLSLIEKSKGVEFFREDFLPEQRARL